MQYLYNVGIILHEKNSTSDIFVNFLALRSCWNVRSPSSLCFEFGTANSLAA